MLGAASAFGGLAWLGLHVPFGDYFKAVRSGEPIPAPECPWIMSGNWGTFSIQGRREYQEDRAFCAPFVGLYAVFDGHGGPLASETAMRTCMINFERARSAVGDGAKDVPWLEMFKGLEESYRKASAGVPDDKGSKRGEGREGSTACVALVQDEFISVANAGDSRCVLCEKNGKATALSVDHKPDDKDELARLTREGFKVVRGRVYQTTTNKGGLNMSRALGDFHYGNGVTCEPDVVEKKIGPDDELLILATDGLWDVVSNETACKLALEEKKKPSEATKKLVMYAFDHNSQDNITVVVVRL